MKLHSLRYGLQPRYRRAAAELASLRGMGRSPGVEYP